MHAALFKRAAGGGMGRFSQKSPTRYAHARQPIETENTKRSMSVQRRASSRVAGGGGELRQHSLSASQSRTATHSAHWQEAGGGPCWHLCTVGHASTTRLALRWADAGGACADGRHGRYT